MREWLLTRTDRSTKDKTSFRNFIYSPSISDWIYFVVAMLALVFCIRLYENSEPHVYILERKRQRAIESRGLSIKNMKGHVAFIEELPSIAEAKVDMQSLLMWTLYSEEVL